MLLRLVVIALLVYEAERGFFWFRFPSKGVKLFFGLFRFFEAVVSNVEKKVFIPKGAVDSLLSIGNSLRKLVSKLSDFSLLFSGFPSLSNILDWCNRKSCSSILINRFYY